MGFIWVLYQPTRSNKFISTPPAIHVLLQGVLDLRSSFLLVPQKAEFSHQISKDHRAQIGFIHGFLSQVRHLQPLTFPPKKKCHAKNALMRWLMIHMFFLLCKSMLLSLSFQSKKWINLQSSGLCGAEAMQDHHEDVLVHVNHPQHHPHPVPSPSLNAKTM